MTSQFTDISAALDVNLNVYAAANSVSVAWENIDFTPTAGTLFVRPTLLPADSVQSGLGATGIDNNLGIYQIDVIAPLDKGKFAATSNADLIGQQFKRGTILTYNGLTVTLSKTSRGSGIRDGGWFIIPVFVTYQSFTQPR